MQTGWSNFIQGVRINELYVLQLPADLQHKVRTYVSSKRRQSDGNSGNNTAGKPEPKVIKVPIPTFPPTAMVYSINKVPAGEYSDSSFLWAGTPKTFI
jgi:hypothetical protein